LLKSLALLSVLLLFLLQQNLGAMLRSAYCLGASGVIGCSRNCAPLTPVVSKASAGAAELMPLHSCRWDGWALTMLFLS
jgi:tRNA G18 (ribose-2'-O)-methylase SpoU